jgi:hypothetical protein
MRIEIRRLNQAKFYGKLAKQLLLPNLTVPEGMHFPSQRTRNAICRGFGYRSYSEVEHLVRNPNRALPPAPSDEELLIAFKQGFALALADLYERGFTTEESPQALADQLASEAVYMIQARHAERDRENATRGNTLLPGESHLSGDLAERALALKNRFRSPASR